MEWTHLLAFNLTLLAAILSPGPSLLFLSRTAMVHGRRAGVTAAIGLGVMAALWTLAALLGLQVLFDLFPWAQSAMKIAGGTYLLWIAYQTWKHAAEPAKTDVISTGHGRLFMQGLLVNLANPKSVLFAGAVIVAIFPPNLTPADKAIIFANHLMVELTLQPALAVLLSTSVVRNNYLSAKSILDRVTGTLMGALGLRLILDRTQ